MYYVYIFLNEMNEVIYVGYTNNIKKRINCHFSSNGHLVDECYNNTVTIQYCEFNNSVEAKLFEAQYIAFMKPVYNKEYIGFESKKYSSIISDIKWKNFKYIQNKKKDDKVFIKINKEMLKTVKFSSIEEFRCYFMLHIKKENKLKFSEENFKEIIFRNKKNVNNKLLNEYVKYIEDNCFLFIRHNDCIKLHLEDLVKFKTMNQVYAYIAVNWDADVSYIDKEVFYTWFNVASKKRAQTVTKSFKDIGYTKAKYILKDGKVIVYKDIDRNNEVIK